MAKEDLYQELQKEIRKANQRLDRIEKTFGKDSWGSKTLRGQLASEKLNKAISKTGKIKIDKTMSEAQLKGVQKAVGQFLKHSKSSTVSGIKSTIKSQKAGIKRGMNISDEDVDEIYSYFENDDFRFLVDRYKEYSSDFINLMQEAKEKNWSKGDFEDQMQMILNYSNDSELKQRVENIYDKLL